MRIVLSCRKKHPSNVKTNQLKIREKVFANVMRLFHLKQREEKFPNILTKYNVTLIEPTE